MSERKITPSRRPGIQADMLKPFTLRACELGAYEAKIINAATVLTAPWVRLKCRFGCELYGLGYCCPPHTPTPHEMREVIACYEHALLFHCTKLGSPTRIACDLEREIFLEGYHKAIGLGSGPCRICRKCSPKGCKHPDRARPSMEACGIDVFATVRTNGFPIEVLKDETCTGNYYGLVLID
jgi:predicted metal-binding protein